MQKRQGKQYDKKAMVVDYREGGNRVIVYMLKKQEARRRN